MSANGESFAYENKIIYFVNDNKQLNVKTYSSRICININPLIHSNMIKIVKFSILFSILLFSVNC